MKANPWSLIKAHYATLSDARTGKAMVADHLLFEGAPILVLATGIVFRVKLPEPALVGLITVTGVMSAFLFSVMLQMAERAMFWTDAEPDPSADTSRIANFLEQIAANAGYAAIVSIVAASLFVAAAIAGGWLLVFFSSLGLAVAAHLVFVLLMVVVRVFALTQRQLLEARTGATVTRLPRRRAS